MTTAAISNFMTFSGTAMMIGIPVSAAFDGILAGSSDYDRKCESVKKLTQAINDFNSWAEGSIKTLNTQNYDIKIMNNNVTSKTAEIIAAMKDSKKQQDKVLKRTRLISAIITMLVSFVFMLKINLANF